MNMAMREVEITPDDTMAAQSDSSDDEIDIFLGNQPLAKARASIYASPVFRNWWYVTDWLGHGEDPQEEDRRMV